MKKTIVVLGIAVACLCLRAAEADAVTVGEGWEVLASVMVPSTCWARRVLDNPVSTRMMKRVFFMV